MRVLKLTSCLHISRLHFRPQLLFLTPPDPVFLLPFFLGGLQALFPSAPALVFPGSRQPLSQELHVNPGNSAWCIIDVFLPASCYSLFHPQRCRLGQQLGSQPSDGDSPGGIIGSKVERRESKWGHLKLKLRNDTQTASALCNFKEWGRFTIKGRKL